MRLSAGQTHNGSKFTVCRYYPHQADAADTLMLQIHLHARRILSLAACSDSQSNRHRYRDLSMHSFAPNNIPGYTLDCTLNSSIRLGVTVLGDGIFMQSNSRPILAHIYVLSISKVVLKMYSSVQATYWSVSTPAVHRRKGGAIFSLPAPAACVGWSIQRAVRWYAGEQ
jgi:hypothetical protein